jgi:hypothetical protein
VMVFPDGRWHSHLTHRDLPDLIARYLDDQAGRDEPSPSPPAKEA